MHSRTVNSPSFGSRIDRAVPSPTLIALRAPELDDDDTLMWLGRFIARIHVIGARKTFEHRPAIDPVSYGEVPLASLLAGGLVPATLRAAYEAAARHALERVRRRFEEVSGVRRLRLHGDCHAGNILWSDGPYFVDFDDSRTGPAIQDLWMLLSGDRANMTRQLAAAVEGYANRSKPEEMRAERIIIAGKTIELR